MKKFLVFLLLSMCLLFCMVGCGNNESAENGNVSPVTDTNVNAANDKKLEEGKFYTVTEAYESGYFTREQIMSIAYYHNRGNYMNEEIMDENYTPLPKTPETLSEETNKAIIDSFYDSEDWNQYNCAKEDLVYLYYGTYCNAIVLKMGIERETVYLRAWEEKLDDVTIYYRNHKRMLVFIDYDKNSEDKKLEEGKFYTVTEAYESGYLTREQVMSIAYYHNRGNYKNEEIMGEDYTPLPKTPEKPSEETKEAIIDSFYNSKYWKGYKDYNTKEDIGYAYYGTYGKTVVVMICVGIEAVGDEEGEEKIDGVTIYYSNTKRLSVWISGN